MEGMIILLIVGVLIAGIIIALPIILAILAILIYVVTNLYPWLRKIAIWCAKPANMAAFGVIGAILFVLAIFGVIVFPGAWRIAPLILLLPPAIGFFIPVQIGLFVWLIRLIIWIYRRWRGILTGIYSTIRMQFMKAKIKVDVGKDTDWRVKVAEMKSKLSAEAEQARKKVSGRK